MIFDQCFTPNLYKYLLKTARANRSFSSFLTAVSHQSYLNICSKLNSEIVHFHDFRHRFHTKVIQISAQNQVRKSFIFMIYDQCFTPNLYKSLLKTTCGNRSFSWFSTSVSHQSYISIRSKTASGTRSFSSFPTPVSHQSYFNTCSKLSSEIVHFHDFRSLAQPRAASKR